MSPALLHVGIIGCGNIARPYANELVADPLIELVGCADQLPERAQALAAQVGCMSYTSVEALLADLDIHAVVNLTTHRAHPAVTEAALKAGKHAYSEKPMAMSREDAQRLVALARGRGLRLASAPSTFMGEAQQTAWRHIREGAIGTVRAIYAEVNWGRIESWHPAPEAFYDVGVMPDVGIYPLSVVTAIFGPARRVQAYATVIYPDRTTMDGRPFHVETPEFVVAVVEMESGPIVRLTANWYVEQPLTKQHGIEFHGDRGSLTLRSWLEGNTPVEIGVVGGKLEPVPLLREPTQSIVWSRAVTEMARAITERRPHRANGEHAAHLVDILVATSESAASGRPVEIESTFLPPEPMEWAV